MSQFKKDKKHRGGVAGKAHRSVHIALHRALDELIADWIDSPGRPSISKNSVLDLMKWSAKQQDEAE